MYYQFFTINLIGDNTVKHVYKEKAAGAGIYADNNVTIIGNGTLTAKLTVEANAFSKKAEEAITAAGGAIVKL